MATRDLLFPPGSIIVKARHDNTTDGRHEMVILRIDFLDRLGRANNFGTQLWLVAQCNKPLCPARVLVREDVVTGLVTAHIDGLRS